MNIQQGTTPAQGSRTLAEGRALLAYLRWRGVLLRIDAEGLHVCVTPGAPYDLEDERRLEEGVEGLVLALEAEAPTAPRDPNTLGAEGRGMLALAYLRSRGVVLTLAPSSPADPGGLCRTVDAAPPDTLDAIDRAILRAWLPRLDAVLLAEEHAARLVPADYAEGFRGARAWLAAGPSPAHHPAPPGPALTGQIARRPGSRWPAVSAPPSTHRAALVAHLEGRPIPTAPRLSPRRALYKPSKQEGLGMRSARPLLPHRDVWR